MGLTRTENIVSDWALSEMVVNSCLEDLDGRMRLKKMLKLIPQEGKKKSNEWR